MPKLTAKLTPKVTSKPTPKQNKSIHHLNELQLQYELEFLHVQWKNGHKKWQPNHKNGSQRHGNQQWGKQ